MLLSYYMKLEESLVPPSHLNDVEKRGTSLTMVRLSLMGVVMTLMLKFTYILLDLDHSLVVWMIATGLLMGLFVLRITGSYLLAGSIFALCHVGSLTYRVLNSGGLYSEDVYWVWLASVPAFFVAGRSSGLFWTFVAIFFYIFTYRHAIATDSASVTDSLIANPLYYLVNLAYVLLALVMIVFAFDTQVTELTDHLRKNQEELEGYNLRLEQRVAERSRELERSNRRLAESNADLEHFAHIASHDLQEPLRTVGNFVQLLERNYKGKIEGSGKEYIQYAVSGVLRMSRLVSDLLEYSKMGNEGLELEQVDLQILLEQKLEDFKVLIKERDVTVTQTSALPAIGCVPSLVSMIFHNLIGNAIKFNPADNPLVEIGAEEQGEYWQFWVRDNGIGIDPKYHRQVFEVFKRLHSKEEYEGTGIGLAICKRAAQHHRGSIWLLSEDGEGSCFYFTIKKGLAQDEVTAGTPSCKGTTG